LPSLTLTIRVPLETYDQLKAGAAAAESSVNAYVLRLLQQGIAKDQKKAK
jgi:predicted HicB family RNase H-like nuclease